MNAPTDTDALKAMQSIPSIGPKVGQMLLEVGVRRVEDLVGASPEALYQGICQARGEVLDRCVLYHFRCAVYFASESAHDPARLKW